MASAVEDFLLTPDQVIDRLLAEPALRRVAVDCVLPAVRVGDEWRFRARDLDAWIARRRSLQPTQ